MTATVNPLIRALGPRFMVRALVLAVVVLVALAPAAALAEPFLTAADVTDITRTAATAVSPTSIIIAVVDRAGVPLGVYLGPTATAADTITGNITQQLYQGGAPVNAMDYAVGLARTKELFLTGNNFEARRAWETGLVHEIVGDDELERASVELAGRIASSAPLSLKGNKQAIEMLNANPVLSPEQERELIELRASSFASEDFREGITAFSEKRKPRWRGR